MTPFERIEAQFKKQGGSGFVGVYRTTILLKEPCYCAVGAAWPKGGTTYDGKLLAADEGISEGTYIDLYTTHDSAVSEARENRPEDTQLVNSYGFDEVRILAGTPSFTILMERLKKVLA